MSKSTVKKSKNDRQLRNVLINPKYQLRYVFWLSLTGLIMVASNAAVFYFFTKENYDFLVTMSPMTNEAKDQMYRELYQVMISLASCSLVFILIIFIIGIFFSHRTAGPLYHMKRICEAVTDGDSDARVRLRPSDDFQEVASAFNRMLEKLTSQGAEKNKK